MASHPANLSSGPKWPPTLESITECVVGEMATTRDLPEPGYWVTPPMGPEEMTISFSGSFHCVSSLTPCHRSHRPNPRPPMNFSFITSVTGLAAMVLLDRLT